MSVVESQAARVERLDLESIRAVFEDCAQLRDAAKMLAADAVRLDRLLEIIECRIADERQLMHVCSDFRREVLGG
jgi:hypothetical protein